LEKDLEALLWKRSKFMDDSRWLPRDRIPDKIIALMETHNGRFFGSKSIYYLTKSGNITKYSLIPDPNAGTRLAQQERVLSGIGQQKPVCPECGMPMDDEHRGQHNHS
jgi:hypothetical protein